MAKPATRDGYNNRHTIACERVLVTLLRGLGPWKDSVYLIGGLTPRYLIPTCPPAVPEHVGTLDVDIVIDLQILTKTQAYHTLEANLRKMRFERAENDKGQKLSWRWQTYTEDGTPMVLEFLTDAPEIAGGKVGPLPTKGTISALHIPHSSIVLDLHQTTEIRAELLNGDGVVVEEVKHADLVSFVCLKALAFDQRNERKDAYDLIYCIRNAPDGLDALSASFVQALASKHGAVIQRSLDILEKRFSGDGSTEGYRKDGPIAFARFEPEEGDGPESGEARIVRQRNASELVEQFLAKIGK